MIYLKAINKESTKIQNPVSLLKAKQDFETMKLKFMVAEFSFRNINSKYCAEKFSLIKLYRFLTKFNS